MARWFFGGRLKSSFGSGFSPVSAVKNGLSGPGNRTGKPGCAALKARFYRGAIPVFQWGFGVKKAENKPTAGTIEKRAGPGGVPHAGELGARARHTRGLLKDTYPPTIEKRNRAFRGGFSAGFQDDCTHNRAFGGALCFELDI